jgi:hypothetical protein
MMTREAIKRLLVAAGLALLMALGVVLPIRAAPSSQLAGLQGAEGVALVTTTPSATPATIPTLTGTLTQPPSAAPTLTPTSTTPSPLDVGVTFISNNGLLAAAICLIPLLILGLLLIPWILRRKKPRPVPTPPPPTPTGPHLESVGTPDGPRRFNLKPEGTTIGRAPDLSSNDLTITQDFPRWETVSHRHARIYQRDDRWIVEDNNSMNGIYVNGRRTGRNLLRDGCQLNIGGVEFVFRADTGERSDHEDETDDEMSKL